MKWYQAPDSEPTPVFEAWLSSTVGEVGAGAFLAAGVVAAIVLRLWWRRARGGATGEKRPAGGESGSQS